MAHGPMLSFCSRPSDFGKHCYHQPQTTHYCRNNSVSNFDIVGCASKSQSKSSINDSQGNHEPSVPKVQMRPDLTSSKLLKPYVVDEPNQGLEEKCDKNHDANYWMIINGRIPELPLLAQSGKETKLYITYQTSAVWWYSDLMN